MYGTYLTKCWWQHYDGHPYRLSYMVYVIGDPASGKSFVIRQDEAIMKLLRDQDAALTVAWVKSFLIQFMCVFKYEV